MRVESKRRAFRTKDEDGHEVMVDMTLNSHKGATPIY